MMNELYFDTINKKRENESDLILPRKPKYATTTKCVCCGKEIPEGQQVCYICWKSVFGKK